jgi:hypothetical protein
LYRKNKKREVNSLFPNEEKKIKNWNENTTFVAKKGGGGGNFEVKGYRVWTTKLY